MFCIFTFPNQLDSNTGRLTYVNILSPKLSRNFIGGRYFTQQRPIFYDIFDRCLKRYIFTICYLMLIVFHNYFPSLKKIDIQRKTIAIQMSFIIQMVLTIACEKSEFVEETLGKLWRRNIYERHSSLILLNDSRKHFKVSKIYMNTWRLFWIT